MSRKSIQVVLMAACFIFSISGMASGLSIVNSKHDFSINSSGTPFGGANFELANTYPVEEICVFCHTPHNAAAPGAFLWNRTNTAATGYTLYTSTTLTMITLEQPTGLTLMCMSCHDGITSIAVLTLINAPYSPLGRSQVTLVGSYSKIGDLYKNDVLLPGWGANIGNLVPGVGGTVANLADDHPVAFTWQDGIPGVNNYATWSGTALKLFRDNLGNNRMECSTCHDVHDNANPPFLRMSNAGSTMCTTCHAK